MLYKWLLSCYTIQLKNLDEFWVNIDGMAKIILWHLNSLAFFSLSLSLSIFIAVPWVKMPFIVCVQKRKYKISHVKVVKTYLPTKKSLFFFLAVLYFLYRETN
jgi:hypothetical protein